MYMMQFWVLMQKEFRESWRSFKFLWIPLVFVLLGVSEPLTNYYMMDILKAVGNMPEGFEMIIPKLTSADIVKQSISQFQLIGLIVLIATFMGAISRERKNGTATLLYVRPISFSSYFLSKWVVANLVAIVGVLGGFVGSLYYTVLLYGKLNWGEFALAALSYCLWVIFVITVTLMMSAAFTMVVAATCSFVVVFVGMIVDSMVGTFWTVSPWKLVNYGMQFLYDGPDKGHFGWSVSVTVFSIVVFIILGIFASKRNAPMTKV